MPEVVQNTPSTRHASYNHTRDAFGFVRDHGSTKAAARMIANNAQILPARITGPQKPFVQDVAITALSSIDHDGVRRSRFRRQSQGNRTMSISALRKIVNFGPFAVRTQPTIRECSIGRGSTANKHAVVSSAQSRYGVAHQTLPQRRTSYRLRRVEPRVCIAVTEPFLGSQTAMQTDCVAILPSQAWRNKSAEPARNLISWELLCIELLFWLQFRCRTGACICKPTRHHRHSIARGQ